MEEKQKPQQEDEEQQSKEANPVKNKNRYLKYIIFAFVNIIIVVIFATIIIANQNTTINEQTTYEDNQLPELETATPTQAQIKQETIDAFVPYSELPETSESPQLNTFSDPSQNINFNYPSRYHMQSINADERVIYEHTLITSVFFVLGRDAEKEEAFKNLIECETDPNIGGICRESNYEDVEVTIHEEDDEYMVKHNIEYYDNLILDKNNLCEKEVLKENKFLYSCVRPMSVGPDDPGMSYEVFILRDDFAKEIKIRTRKPLEYADLIKKVIESVDIN